MSDFELWDQRTADLLEAAYVAAGPGPGGSGSGDLSEGGWRAKRQHLAVPMSSDGRWLDVGCANGHLMHTLPGWAAERGVRIEPHGLELLEPVARVARHTLPHLADRIFSGSVMTWQPSEPFDYVTALDDCVPPDRLGDLVTHLLSSLVAPGGRLILSSYASRQTPPRDLFTDLVESGYPPAGRIYIERPDRFPLVTAWIDNPSNPDQS